MNVREKGSGVTSQTRCIQTLIPLALFGGIHLKVGKYHRLLSKRFPYAIYYRMNEGTVDVWRVLDCRQDPRRTKRALH